MGRLTGVDVRRRRRGHRRTSACPCRAWFEWSHGSVPGGVLALAADAALGCALQSLLPAHTQYTTAEMSMTYLRPARVGSVVTAHGRALHAGSHAGPVGGGGHRRRRPARRVLHIADADLRRGRGERSDARRHGRAAGARRAATNGSDEGPDPYLRPVSGERIDESVFLERSGVEILHAQIRGDLPLPPMHHLLGITPTEATLGAATCVDAADRLAGHAVRMAAGWLHRPARRPRTCPGNPDDPRQG